MRGGESVAIGQVVTGVVVGCDGVDLVAEIR
jgi:hypothetical protein